MKQVFEQKQHLLGYYNTYYLLHYNTLAYFMKYIIIPSINYVKLSTQMLAVSINYIVEI